MTWLKNVRKVIGRSEESAENLAGKGCWKVEFHRDSRPSLEQLHM